MHKKLFLVIVLGLLALVYGYDHHTDQESQSRGVEAQQPETLRFCSWNIRILSKKRSADALKRIAAILYRYDFVNILEVRDEEVVIELCRILAQSDKTYKYEISAPVGNKIKERYCFLYDADKIKVVKPGCVYPDSQDVFLREPYYATFAAKHFDFTVIAVHIIWGRSVKQRRREIVAMAQVFREIQDQDPKENDVILAGDFNRPPEDDLAFAALKSVPGMIYLFAAPDKSMIGDTNLYDNIFFQKNYVQEFLGHKGIHRFDELDFVGDRRTASRVVSDHRPIWAEFSDAGPDDD